MPKNWMPLPRYESQSDVPRCPEGWRVLQVQDIYDDVPAGKRYEKKSVLLAGVVPVLDQSESGVIGYHNESPGVSCSIGAPVVTFANHTCEMRYMTTPYSCIQNVFSMVGKPGVCTTPYLYYGNKGRVRLEEYKGHHPQFRSIWIPVPPLSEQRAIASILSAFDDKIELNRRTAATLEEMARVVFKSWFVDFDPVRAKAEGREPEWMDAETATLFPDSFGDDGLPEGWAWIELGDALSVLETGTRPKGGIKGISEGVPSVGAESINGLAVFDFSKTKRVPFEFFEKAKRGKVESRDVLLYKDGGRLEDALRPKVGLYGDGFPFREFAINEHVFRLRVAAPFGQNFLYFWMTTDALLHEMHAKGTGSAIPGINQPAVRSLSLIRPSTEALKAFDDWCDPLVTRCLSLANESRQLAVVRDTLLPRLLSGEIRVGDAEKIAEGVL